MLPEGVVDEGEAPDDSSLEVRVPLAPGFLEGVEPPLWSHGRRQEGQELNDLVALVRGTWDVRCLGTRLHQTVDHRLAQPADVSTTSTIQDIFSFWKNKPFY